MHEVAGSRVLVTGGAGFIGSHLVDALLARGAEAVTVVDSFFLGRETNLDDARIKAGDRLRVHRDDAGDPNAMSAIVRAERPTVVFNLATKALRYSFLNPAGACRINLDIALVLAELLRGGAFEKLVHVSTSEVYGSAQRVPMDESHPLLAETTYAAGKAAADLAIASYVRMFDLDIVTARPFNNYGPRQNDGDYAALIPITVRRIQRGLPPIVEGDGQQTRDFSFVLDTVASLLRIAELEVPPGSTLNVGSGFETTVREVIDTIADVMGWTGGIEHAPERSADVRRHCADTTLADSLGVRPDRTNLRDGLERTIAWYLEGGGA